MYFTYFERKKAIDIGNINCYISNMTTTNKKNSCANGKGCYNRIVENNNNKQEVIMNHVAKRIAFLMVNAVIVGLTIAVIVVFA